MNKTLTNAFILSDSACFCKLFLSDRFSCTCQQREWSALVSLHSVFPCSSSQTELFVFYPGIIIEASVQVDPDTGLSTTSSALEYSAVKEDTDAKFSCSTEHPAGKELSSSPEVFAITCKSANDFLWTRSLKCSSSCSSSEWKTKMLVHGGLFSLYFTITAVYEMLILCPTFTSLYF